MDMQTGSERERTCVSVMHRQRENMSGAIEKLGNQWNHVVYKIENEAKQFSTFIAGSEEWARGNVYLVVVFLVGLFVAPRKNSLKFLNAI